MKRKNDLMTGGSVTVNLTPPLDGATIEMRFKSFGYDELAGFIYSVDGKVTFRGDFYTAGLRYQIKLSAQKVDDLWYDEARTREFDWYEFDWSIGLILLRGNGPKGDVTEFNLPDTLEEDEIVTGNIKITNMGDIAAPFRCRFTTEWNNSEYVTEETELAPGAILTAVTPYGDITMPDIDAIIKIQVERHYIVIAHTNVWEIDDIKYH